jgi:hypothetical protein
MLIYQRTGGMATVEGPEGEHSEVTWALSTQESSSVKMFHVEHSL